MLRKSHKVKPVKKSSKKTPKSSSKKTPKSSSKKTPKRLSKKTPKRSSKKTPKRSSKKTPKRSSKKSSKDSQQYKFRVTLDRRSPIKKLSGKSLSTQSFKDLLKSKLGLTEPIIDHIINCNLGKKDLLDILNSLDKKIEDEYKEIVGVIRRTINKERELTPPEKTMFMNMAMTMAKDMNLDQQIFKGLLGQIKNQKCQDGIMNIMRNMPKSHFAAAANKCRKCRQQYIDNGKHDTEKCNVDGCKDLVILSQCKHGLCHSSFVELKNLYTDLVDCPCGKANVGELKIYDRSNIESNVSQLSVMFVFILFVIVYALVEGPSLLRP